MLALVVVVAACCTLAGYALGRRQQRYTQARADVRDLRGKLTKAHKARSTLRAEALGGWFDLGVALLLLVLVALAVTR